MKKNLILMSALFAGAMFMNNGFGMNDGIPFDPTCDGVINYIMRENDNNRAITLQLRHIAQNPNWLDGLPRVDLIQLKNFVNSLSNDSFTRNGYIQTIDEHIQMVDEHIQALMQNNEAQNNVDGEILNQAQEGNMEPENLQLAVVRGNAYQIRPENLQLAVVHGNINQNRRNQHIRPANPQLAVVRYHARQNEHHGNFARRMIDYVRNNPMIDYVRNNPIINYVRNHPIQSAIVVGAVVVEQFVEGVHIYTRGH